MAPDSAEQVQEIVRIANEFRIPLYPISTGRNLGYGGSAPALSGSVVARSEAHEPHPRGQTSATPTRSWSPASATSISIATSQERGLKLWIDCPDPGWGSVVGNALDHGVGYTMNPYRDHWDAHCGLEVVTGDGELVRTGMGALPSSRDLAAVQVRLRARTSTASFSQSNFGVVTKMGVWLMPAARGLRRLHGRACSATTTSSRSSTT